jgi:hypothetical protein
VNGLRAGATARWDRVRRLWPELRRQVLPWLLGLIGNATGTVLLFGAAEHTNVFRALWFGLVSGTTTGFGDVLPTTSWGYALAAYLLASCWVLDRITTARLLKVLIEDPDLYSHAEQERDEAAGELQLAWLHTLLQYHGLNPRDTPEWQRWCDAHAAADREG